MVKIYGYGYRKNCFGERLFYEDSMEIADVNAGKKLIGIAMRLAKNDPYFSFKLCCGTECWAVWCREEDKENGVFAVNYSPRWNVYGEEQKMSGKALRKELVNRVEEEVK